MSIDLVIFDCDGVLVDSEAITTATIIEAVGAAGLAWSADVVMERHRGGNLAGVQADAEAQLGRSLPADFVERFRARLFERLRAEIQPIAGIAAALEAIAHPMCVASNGPIAKMEATLGTTGLMKHFEGRVFSAYDIDCFKPDPGLFLHAARTLRAEPARCVVIEDSDNGVEAAVAAGMRVLAYVGHGYEMHARGAEPFGDMGDLPGLLG